MLSGVAEKKMRPVRLLLTVAWVALIISLFWDPFSAELTRPDNQKSPFQLSGAVVEVQGKPLPQVPFQMSNWIFWTMIIPLLPLLFMVAGHEAWRRICPLSFVSQIPRYLGWNRKRTVLIRRTGIVQKQIALVSKDSWWRRNVWYVQFGLLFVALNARILLINSDRTALGLFFIGVIILALIVGYLWGGKTWCNYICPIAIVQKIYTEPRGLLESQAHISRTPITQSMCRTPTPEGDRSNCVGCTSNCPDIDLERSYWENIGNPALRHVYYGFFGLIVGYFMFYYLYSGNWDYYFSGAWTHESNQIGSLFEPGLYINNTPIGIPKIISSPLVLGFSVVAAIFLGGGLERIYRYVVKRSAIQLSESAIVSRCLTFSAYLSINVFYLFSGRNNLTLMHPAAVRFVDILIVALTTLWFWQATQRTPLNYRRESLASSLLEQLRKLKVDISKFLEGRKLDDLKPDEIYVLAKTLPGFSREQRLQVYRNILEDALRTGKADSAASLQFLREVRIEIDISDDEHRQVLHELGIEGIDAVLDPDKSSTFEDWFRVDSYRRAIEPIILGQIQNGKKLADILKEADVAETIRKFREIYQLTEDEHSKITAAITGSGGMIFERAKTQLELLLEHSAIVFGLRCKKLQDPQWTQISNLLVASTVRRTNTICHKLFSILLTLGNTRESRWIAMQMSNLAGADIETPLALPVASGARTSWLESLDPSILSLLRGDNDSMPGDSLKIEGLNYRSVIEMGVDLTRNLKRMVMSEDSAVGGVALTAISYLDPIVARETAAEIARGAAPNHWLLTEVVNTLLGTAMQADDAHPAQALSVTLVGVNGSQQTTRFAKEHISVGRAPDNDLVVHGQFTSPYHLAIVREGSKVYIRRTDPFAKVYINGEGSELEKVEIAAGARVSFLPPPHFSSLIVVDWTQISNDYTVESHDTVTKLIWLSRANMFRELKPSFLADIAASVETRRYAAGMWLCHAGDASNDAYLLQAGSVEVVVERDGQSEVAKTLHEGTLIGELGVITGRPRTASIRISSPMARLLTINGERLRWLMERDVTVSMNMLSVVASYVKS